MRCSIRRHTIVAFALLTLSTTFAADVVNAAVGECSQPVTNGAVPVATDCLFILNVALELETCVPRCICAPKGFLPTVAADALACLLRVIRDTVVHDCPCSGDTTSTTVTSSTSTTTITTSVTSSTTTTLGEGGDCPDTIEITSFARVGAPCADDADCLVGICDLALARCTTATNLDLGWTGVGHDMDTNDEAILRARLDCGENLPCGVCRLNGVDRTARMCRCAGDNRTICDEPFVADEDDCAGEICACYLGAPLPISAGNSPACFVNRLGQDVTGTVNVDTGEFSITLALRAGYYIGDTLVEPCPSCVNDTVSNDGVRDGTCDRGANSGASCDVDARNKSFPAPGGEGHSLDCFPDAGKNSSGAGLFELFSLTTGPTALTAEVDCTSFGIPSTCHCGVCGLNPSLACRSDSDCEAMSAGTCGKKGNFDPKVNGCGGTGGCTATESGLAICDEGPTDRYCDGILRSDGRGFIQCFNNDDCTPATIGIDAGGCTLSKPRQCFLPTIDANGVADPDAPIGAAVFCVPPTSGAGKNAVFGLVGPARLVSQMGTRKLCNGSEDSIYVPNLGCIQTTE
jgi:hypothetical protein